MTLNGSTSDGAPRAPFASREACVSPMFIGTWLSSHMTNQTNVTPHISAPLTMPRATDRSRTPEEDVENGRRRCDYMVQRKQNERGYDPVEQAGVDSFPASDPPGWMPLRTGSPGRSDKSRRPHRWRVASEGDRQLGTYANDSENHRPRRAEQPPSAKDST
jgi:hypothetical protein